MSVDLDRLRDLAREPERGAMPRSEMFPSMGAELDRQRQEIAALRRALNDAVAEIERLRAPKETTVEILDGDGKLVQRLS